MRTDAWLRCSARIRQWTHSVAAWSLIVAPASMGMTWSDLVAAKGYLKFLQTVHVQAVDDPWQVNTLLHNRVDATFLPNSPVKLALGLRTRFVYGDFLASVPRYGALLRPPAGFLHLDWTLAKGSSYLLLTELDRAFVDWSTERIQARAGRQRVNWGMNLVWNPNDIFNSYSFLDFDYEERPGMDGVSLIFYPSATSQVTAVYMAGDSAADMRGAALGRANLLGYDLQVLAGYVDNDVCAGAGWSGQIVRAAFRGECTYFHPARDHGVKTVVGSASADYTFPHDIYCQGSFIYNSAGIAGRHGDYAGLDIPGSTAKRLSPCRWTLFAELSAQVTPLFRIDCPGIMNPGDGSGMVGPSCTMSLTEEIDVDFVGQVFFGGSRTVYGGMGKTVNGRLRWSF